MANAVSSSSSTVTAQVRSHYDLLAPFYYLLWGENVHHGFWEDNNDRASPKEAQERLTRELYAFAGSPKNVRMLDIGCGYGGPLRWLLREAHVRRAVGFTISPLQQVIGQAKLAGCKFPPDASRRARLVIADVQERWPVDDGEYDFVWCCEMTEHLADRAHWAREAFRALRPGGTLVLAAWLKGEDLDAARANLARRMATDTVGHPFDTAPVFEALLSDAGFSDIQTRLVTDNIVRTWDIATDMIARRPILNPLARALGGDIEAYVRAFPEMARAFRTGAMEYGFFAARKP